MIQARHLARPSPFRTEMSRSILSHQTRRNITTPAGFLYNIAKKMMPKISDTERAALNAGTVGFDRNIFSGNPMLADLRKYKVSLTPEEKCM